MEENANIWYYFPMKKVLIWLLYALAFTPLIVTKSLFFPFISGKSIFIRLVVTLVAVGFAWLVFKERGSEDRGSASADRGQTSIRMRKLLKNKVFWFVGAFMVLMIISTLFAVNPYRAFFGDTERAEGLVTMLFLFGFFVFASLLFERKNWLMFFKLTLISGAVLFIHELVQLSQKIPRPASFTGNPIYLAVVFLFVIFAGWVVLQTEVRLSQNQGPASRDRGWAFGKFWKMFSAVMVPVSLLGIFITETRGVIVGIAVAIMATLIYIIVRNPNQLIDSNASNGNPSADATSRKLAVVALGVLVVLGGIFYTTRDAELWNRIPGFDRISEFTFQNNTVQTRLISLGVSLRGINPADNGIGRFLVGWGPENFNIAYNTYYNPEFYRYEQAWFDRAHNKLMDVLVMHGVLGFVAYMGIWVALWWGLKGRKIQFEDRAHEVQDQGSTFRDQGRTLEPHTRFVLPVLFFSVAYFVQNLFVFDAITTYIPFFMFLAFVIYNSNLRIYSNASNANDAKGEKLTTHNSQLTTHAWIFAAAALFYALAFIAWTWVPYGQIHSYMQLLKSRSTEKQLSEGYFKPYTFTQEIIRKNVIESVTQQYSGTNGETNLLLFSVDLMRDVADRELYNPRYSILIGEAYDALGRKKDPAYYTQAEEMYRKALSLSPTRQNVYYLLGFNLSLQNRYDEAIRLLEKAIALDSRVAGPHFYLGLFLTSAGDLEQYERALDEFIISEDLGGGGYGGGFNHG